MDTRETRTAKTLPPVVLAGKLCKLERSGRFETGLALFGDNFSKADFLPDVEDLTASEAAEILLRFGSLIGFYGYKHQLDGAQDRSKDILTMAHTRYVELNDIAKIAECESYIALGYWRKSEFKEAMIWVDEALSHGLPRNSDPRLYAHLIKSLISLSERRYEENIENCLAVEDDFRRYGDAYLNGSLCTNIGLSFKNCGQNAEAMRYLSLARIFHEKSGHKVYLGSVHNNLAQLYRLEKRFAAAHESVDAAIKLSKQMADLPREAAGYDTKALIYLAEGRLTEAMSAADTSIEMLRKTDNSGYLVDSLMTRSKIFLMDDKFADAVLQLIEAVNITRIENGEAAARCLVDEFESGLKERDMPPVEAKALNKGELELILPASLGNYHEYKGIWINSAHLEHRGIRLGSLAIIVPEAVKRGDLVAITEIATDNVICGVYDAEFGIVCLERGDDEPQLFDDDDIQILGKIVGVCNAGKNADGQMIVEAIS